MMFADLFEETYSALLVNKVRSSLTVLGIVIGISSVIAMIAIGQGSKNTIESNIQSLGANLITVQPGAQKGAGSGGVSSGRGSSETLTIDDATAIGNQIPEAQAVTVELSARQQVTARGTNTNTTVLGTTASYLDVRNVQMGEGSFISDENVASLNKVAVIGPTTATDLFTDGSDPVGQTIRIKGIIFTVIGITAAKGGSGFNNPDDMIYIPVTTAQKFLVGGNYVSSIDVQATDANVMTDLQNEITALLLQRHNISDPTLADFSTLNQQDVEATASSVTQTFTILLAAVASISLVVGGIGIMNMMLTTVTERTREIGLRKAIGAKQGDISRQFLAEAVLLTFTGGLIGIILGWIISILVQKLGGIATSIAPYSIFLAFGVSAVIGIAFGYYPARRASKLNPIEALRYE